MKSGIINIYKEQGYTSFDVVAKLRGILRIKKIGHTGTLDPMAEGVLPVCIGKATRVVDFLADRDKEYRAVVRLGVTTDTDDVTGNVLSAVPSEEMAERVAGGLLTETAVRDVVSQFVGEIAQIPPMYAAIKVGGKKLYELARAGQTIERKPRRVTIYGISAERVSWGNFAERLYAETNTGLGDATIAGADTFADYPEIEMTVRCSKGTYIRSLARDIGERLGCGGTLAALTRTWVGAFSSEDSLRLSEVEELLAEETSLPTDRDEADYGSRRLDALYNRKKLVSIDEVFAEYPKIVFADNATKNVLNGGAVAVGDVRMISENPASVSRLFRGYLSDNAGGSFVGLYEMVSNGQGNIFQLKKMFYE